MHPEICTIGPFTVYSYGLMLAFAFLISIGLAGIQAKKTGLSAEFIFNLGFIAMVFGIIGARLFYVAENPKSYLQHPMEIFMLQYGGLSWFGGLFLGSLSAVAYLKMKRQPVYRTLDLLAPFIALAQAIGRIGCLLNGCCYGKASIFGLYFPVHQARLIPTQLYSSLLLLVVFGILRYLQEKSHRPGEVFFTYLFLYSLVRFFIEFWRQDNPIILLGLTLFQIISAIIFVFSLTKLILLKKK